jgi:uncharacterized protein (DUF58 family)
MIVPETRLLWLTAAVVLPCGLVAAAFPRWIWLAAMLVVLLAIVAAADAFLSRKRLDSIKIELPPLLRFPRDREGRFGVTVVRSGGQPRTLRVGIPAPLHLGARQEMVVSLPEGERLRVDWMLYPTRRGSFKVDTVMVETQSAGGLWALRASKAVSAEIRVYPNLFADKKTAASLLMNRGSIGVHAQRQVGKGREFEKLREYAPGDTYDDIHWRATARHGKPVTRVYQVERTQEVYAVIDCSRLSGRDAGGEALLERYLSAALLLGLAVQNDGDLFGVIAFSDRIERFVRAGQGRSHFGACRDAIYTLTARRTSPDFQELSQFVRTRLRKRALLVVLTALEDPVISEDFERNIGVLRGKQLVIAGMANATGVAPLFSDASVETTEDVLERLSGHLRWHQLNETQSRLRAIGVPLSLMREDSVGAEVVAQYRNIKTRQIL